MEQALVAAEETIAAARNDARRSRESIKRLTKSTAALGSREEPSMLPVNRGVDTPSAVTGSAKLVELEARGATIVSAQQETLQEGLGTAESLEGKLTQAKSRIDELEEELLLCRCRLMTEEPGADGAISVDDRKASASDEAISGGVEPPPQPSE